MGNSLAKEEGSSYYVPVPLTKLLLYGSGPFFVNPVKPVLNALDGSDYRRAYLHFRRDHKVPANIAYHVLCTVFQLTANYPLLATADAALFPGAAWGPIASTSTGLWLWTLLFRSSGAPLPAKLLAVASVLAGHSSRHAILARWQWLALGMVVVEAAALQVFVVNKNDAKNTRRTFNLPQYLKILTPRLLLHALAWVALRGSLSSPLARAVVNAIVALWAVKGSQAPFTSGLFFLGFCSLLAPMTSQPWLYFFTTGYIATLCQGVAHHYAGEPGTLPQLAKVQDELAHVVFFPNLVAHTVYQSLTSGNGVTPVYG